MSLLLTFRHQVSLSVFLIHGAILKFECARQTFKKSLCSKLCVLLKLPLLTSISMFVSSPRYNLELTVFMYAIAK